MLFQNKELNVYGGIKMELGKVPPNDIEAEQAILGSMLTDKDAVILQLIKRK